MTRQRVRRRLDPATRRVELIEAAERVLRTKGATCRVADVVQEAAAAKGTFYVYFNTWDELLIALRCRIFQEFAARFPRPDMAAGSGDWWRFLNAVNVGFIDFVLELGGLHHVVFHGPFAELHPLKVGQGAPVMLESFLGAGMKAGAFARLDPGPTAQLLFSMAHCAADAISAGGNRKQYVNTMLELLHRTLRIER